MPAGRLTRVSQMSVRLARTRLPADHLGKIKRLTRNNVLKRPVNIRCRAAGTAPLRNIAINVIPPRLRSSPQWCTFFVCGLRFIRRGCLSTGSLSFTRCAIALSAAARSAVMREQTGYRAPPYPLGPRDTHT